MTKLEYLSQFSNAVLTGDKVNYGSFKHNKNNAIYPLFFFDAEWHQEWVDQQLESGVFEGSNAVLSIFFNSTDGK